MYYSQEQLLSKEEVENVENSFTPEELVEIEQLLYTDLLETMNSESFITKLKSSGVPEKMILAIISSAYLNED